MKKPSSQREGESGLVLKARLFRFPPVLGSGVNREDSRSDAGDESNPDWVEGSRSVSRSLDCSFCLG